jgi:hypothetical protein
MKGDDFVMIPRILKFLYYVTIVSAFCSNMIVVSQTTTLSVFGAGLALRGPDGSMMTATDGLYEERATVFSTFGVGLACTVGSVVICVWLILHWEAAFCCMVITILAGRTIWRNYLRVQKRFAFDESETVDFSDIMEGPAAIQAVPFISSRRRNKNGMKKGKSLPLEIDQGTTDDDSSNGDWQTQKLLKAYDMKKRRQQKGTEERIQIQTI